jgi:hypothetical protein
MSAPNDNPGVGAVEDKALDKESLIEFLGEDDGKDPETLELGSPGKKDEKAGKEGEKEDKKDDEKESEKELSLEEELEEELKEPEIDDDLENLAVFPSRKEILSAYPDLFKKFPHVERAIYREQRYAELLPTIDDAKTAVGKAELLDRYEKEITTGSTESLLSTVRDNDKEAFSKVVDNYLTTLYNVDSAAYYHTLGNVMKQTIMSMVNASKAKNDDELGEAAAILNNFIFGTTTFTPPSKLSQDDAQDDKSKEKETEISRREKAFLETKFNNARDTIGTKVDNIIKATVDKVIDPNQSMTDYVKGHATNKVLKSLEQAIEKDSRFRAVFDKLWERAFDNDFDTESLDRIQKAYLSKAKTLLPYLINQERREALKGLKRSSDTDTKDKKGHLPVGKTRSSTTFTSGNAKGNTAKVTIPKGMSTLEYLNSDD